MVENTHRDLLVETVHRLGPTATESVEDDQELATSAGRWARSLAWLPSVRESLHVRERAAQLNRRVQTLLGEAETDAANGEKLSEDQQWLHDNARLVRLAKGELQEGTSSLRRTPHVRTPDKVTKPRVLGTCGRFSAHGRVPLFRSRL